MANDRIQLKQEEVVGNDIVLSDINPKSNTKSIDDPVTGASLDKVIERLWNAINNKLSRYVNSVNGRSGVVVLDSTDVGLGNVDNVSFAEIKQWVISRMAQEFGFKRIEMFESLTVLDDTMEHVWLNDEVYANKPFYARHGVGNDRRGYIGYIYYEGGILKRHQLVLDTIGEADDSIIYNEQGHQNGELVDYSGTGKIGVNIWEYEDALEVYTSISGKEHSGLRINKDKIASKLYKFEGVYGDPNDPTVPALLCYGTTPEKAKAIDIYIDGELVASSYTRQPFTLNDIVITNFSDSMYISPEQPELPSGMDPRLTIRKPCIGQITEAPSQLSQEGYYRIDFYSLKQPTFRGLKYETTHHGNRANDPDDQALSVDLLNVSKVKDHGGYEVFKSTPGGHVGLSGMNSMSPYNPQTQHKPSSTPNRREFRTILPSGVTFDIYAGTDNTDMPNNESSMYILPNYSLCVIPYDAFKNDDTTGYIYNWPMSAPKIPFEPNATTTTANSHEDSLLGINLIKGIRSTFNTNNYAINMSGLRINPDIKEDGTEVALDGEWLGNPDFEDTITEHSGGLSVNVGNFLEIGSSNGNYNVEKSKADYYDEGKINVRIDTKKGLYDVPSTTSPPVSTNSIGINLAHDSYIIGARSIGFDWGNNYINGGLRFFIDKYEQNVGLLGVNTGMNGRGLSVQHNVPCDIRYDRRQGDIIYDNNVLGIQLYDMKTGNPENTESWTDVKKPGLELHYGITTEDVLTIIAPDNVYPDEEWDSYNALERTLDHGGTVSGIFDKDHIYAAGGAYYIVNITGTTYEIAPCVVIYTDEDEYNSVIASLTPDDPSYDPQWPATHQYHVFVCEELVGDNEHRPSPSDDRLNKYRIICKKYYDLSSTPNVIPLYLPDVNNDGIVDTVDTSDAWSIVHIFNDPNHVVWLTDDHQGNVRYFTDASCTNELVLTNSLINTYFSSRNYRTLYETDYEMIYQVKEINNQLTLVKYTPSPLYGDWYDWDWDNNAANTENYYQEMMHRIDTDQNGRLLITDSTRIFNFVSCLVKKYKGWNLTTAWIDFMKLEGYTVINGEPEGVDTIFECRYEKGLRVKYDEYRGLTYNPDYVGGVLTDTTSRGASPHQVNYTTDEIIGNATKDALSIKIADPSAGILDFNETSCGGLRFTSEGYLGVRVNMRNSYNAAIPGRRTGADDMTVGTHGLCIYEGNVLGIQHDSSLEFDDNGNLKISTSYTPSIHTLTFTGKNSGGSTVTVPFNGTANVTIEVGPGLTITQT